MNRDGSEDLLWAGWASATAMLVGALWIGLSGVDMPEANDWPAWVQAVGSVIAIVAAILIDRGSARRAREKDREAKADLIADWERCLGTIETLANNAAKLVREERLVDPSGPRRLFENAVHMVDTYLQHPPPSPRLAYALASGRSHLALGRSALKDFAELRARRGVYDGGEKEVARVQALVETAAKKLTNLRTEYEFGVW